MINNLVQNNSKFFQHSPIYVDDVWQAEKMLNMTEMEGKQYCGPCGTEHKPPLAYENNEGVWDCLK